MRISVSLLLVVLGVGCWSSRPPEGVAPDGDGDGDADADADGDSDADADGDADCPVAASRALDLLVVVDDSNTMAQEQMNLTQNFGVLIDSLTAPQDGPTVDSLHVGVVSTDMGTGGFAVQTCRDAVDGDDGILLHQASPDLPGCEDREYPSFLSWQTGGDAAQLVQDFECVANLGTGGCGFEQPLEAARKALTAHRSGRNAGFLRDDSLLAIVLLTDEEDCSVRHDVPEATDIFNTELALGPLNLRCFNHPEYLEPVDRYVADLLALRAGCPERLIVSGIVGIPPGTRHDCNLSNMSDADFQCLLDAPEMQQVVDDGAIARGEQLRPSCAEPGLGEAFPPRRIVETLRELHNAGAAAAVSSICEATFGPAFQQIVEAARGRL